MNRPSDSGVADPLTFWVAGIVPFLFAWALLGLWVALTGGVLCLSGLRIQFLSPGDLADSEAFERESPGPRISLWGVDPPATAHAFCVALGCMWP